MKFLILDQQTTKQLIEQGEVKHYQCYLPLPNGYERIHLGDFFYHKNDDPRGEEILKLFDKDDLEVEVESLEHDAPNSRPEDFWESYDICRVDPYRLIWEQLSTEAALYAWSMDQKLNVIRDEFYGEQQPQQGGTNGQI